MKQIRHPLSLCKRRKGEQIVQNGLAATPSQVLRAAEQGIPASAQMLSRPIEGHSNSDWTIGENERRGVDIGHLWQLQMDAKSKLRAAHQAVIPVEPQSN